MVYGNFNRLILCTKKRRLVDALGYVEYITNSIKSRDLFKLVEMSYEQCWEYLIWMDPVSTDKPLKSLEPIWQFWNIFVSHPLWLIFLSLTCSYSICIYMVSISGKLRGCKGEAAIRVPFGADPAWPWGNWAWQRGGGGWGRGERRGKGSPEPVRGGGGGLLMSSIICIKFEMYTKEEIKWFKCFDNIPDFFYSLRLRWIGT